MQRRDLMTMTGAALSNLLDENVELAQGYPEAGRNLYLRLRLNF